MADDEERVHFLRHTLGGGLDALMGIAGRREDGSPIYKRDVEARRDREEAARQRAARPRAELPCPCCEQPTLWLLECQDNDGPQAAWVGRCPTHGGGRIIATTRDEGLRVLRGEVSRG